MTDHTSIQSECADAISFLVTHRLVYSSKLTDSQTSEDKEAKIDKIMRDVDVWAHRDTMAKSLSGGNKRKLSVAMALVADSKLVLLDEPTSGMDLTARRRLWAMLKDYK